MRFLIFGDIVAKPGRRALVVALPRLKEKHRPDLVIANAENLSHGIGANASAIDECRAAGVDLFTSGNHIWKKREIVTLLNEPDTIVLRPDNYPPGLPGRGYKTIMVGTRKVLIVNLMGRVFFKEDVDCPFRGLDAILTSYYLKDAPAPSSAAEPVDVILIDFHAEATSEKTALARYADGRVTAVWGTHTHVPTADEQMLPQGTAYITDVGMVGLRDSIIGSNTQSILQQFLTQIGHAEMHDVEEHGAVVVNAALLDVPNNGQPSFQRIREMIEV